MLSVSLPGLTGQSSSHGQCLLDRPVKPGDDSIVGGNAIEKCLKAAQPLIETALYFLVRNYDLDCRKKC
jgi:hypothetical protein